MNKKINKTIINAIIQLQNLPTNQKYTYQKLLYSLLSIYQLRELRLSSDPNLQQFAQQHYEKRFKIKQSLEKDLAKIYGIPLNIIAKDFGEAIEADIKSPYIEERDIIAQEFLLHHKTLALVSSVTFFRTLTHLLIKKESNNSGRF